MSQPASSAATVEVLWRPGCPYCARLRRGLRRAGVPTVERDISADPAAAAHVRGGAIAVQHDVGDEDNVRRMVAETVQAFGTVNLLLNNAGVERQVPLLEASLQDWDPTLCQPDGRFPGSSRGRHGDGGTG
jgi:NAD(P)-dependent dehydrogenase (short-subunit alcohol dehydrogenase family)